EAAEPRSLIGVVERDLPANSTDMTHFALPARDLARRIDLVAGNNERHVIRNRDRGFRQHDVSFDKTRHDLPSHLFPPMMLGLRFGKSPRRYQPARRRASSGR